ncbi:MAG: multicopper oxidase domain-containing protein [Gammaproteobacteria bacterium]
MTIGLAERYDVIVDFTGFNPGKTVELLNHGPDEPFKGFNPDGTLSDGEDGTLEPADPETTGKVLQFRVVAATGADASKPLDRLNLPPIKNLSGGTPRRLALLEEALLIEPDGGTKPVETVVAALLGVVRDYQGSPAGFKMMWEDPVTENPAVGSTEVWEIYNCTADAHPIHIHELAFQVVDRQPITFEPPEEEAEIRAARPATDETAGPLVTNIQLVGEARPPEAIELGYKDTVNAYPGEVTRVRVKFENPGQFVWHCHIVSHEDNEMMRPYRIGPEQPGQPT